MSAFFEELGGLTGGVGAEALAFAVGFAAGRALEPAGVTIAQDAWNAAPVRRLEAEQAAEAVAEGYLTEHAGESEASYTGYDASRFQTLYDLALTAPGFGELVTMLRRGTINDGNFTHGLRKAKIEPMWDDMLKELAVNYIGIGDIATAIVRGAVPSPSWVPVPPPAATTNVPRFPVTNIDPVALAAKLGYSEDMLRIMVARSGLSMAPVMAAQANFRGILADDDYLLAVAEGDLRAEWAKALKEVSRQILTAGEYAELQLRGFLTADQRRAKTALHGMTDADSDLLYDVLGRAPAVHAITTGLARGGVFNGPTDGIPEVYLSSMQRGNVRPEYYPIEYANRYSYPSAFVIRALATGGEWDESTTKQTLLELGWKPELVDATVKAWYGAATPTGGKHIAKAQTQVWNAIHKAYVDDNANDQTATSDLEAAGVGADEIPDVLKLWQVERGIVRRSLNATQIKKAVGQPNKDTAWALERLAELGYTTEDATTFLNE